MLRVSVSMRALVTSRPATARLIASIAIRASLGCARCGWIVAGQQFLLDRKGRAQGAERAVEFAGADMVGRGGDGTADRDAARRREQFVGARDEMLVVRLHLVVVEIHALQR